MNKSVERLVNVKTSELIPYARNSRTHSAEQIKKLQASLDLFGFVNPVLVDINYNILAGHGRVLAAKLMGTFPKVPCVMVEHLSETEKRAYILTDNTISYQNTERDRERTDAVIKSIVYSICNVGIERFLINPTGRFEIGGFEGDAGLTGRKIVVDNYQSFANVGGGAFSGKDPTKVDRSGAYKAREIAKRMLLWRGLRWCEVQLSYAIGIAEPLAIYIRSNEGDMEVPDGLYEECTPERIISDLTLRAPIYYSTAQFGHFVR